MLMRVLGFVDWWEMLEVGHYVERGGSGVSLCYANASLLTRPEA
ncbi:hypothetical protein [Fulvivirga sediminis]|nr:hypothetical protein [Fulvivirga sediminis]